MFWVAAGFVILGAACGAAFRVLFLIAVLLAATAVVVVSDIARGSPNVFFDAVIAIIALQVGYALGIGVRAFVYARRRSQELAMKPGQARYPSAGSRRERR
jgi:hypothetical protein